MATAAPGPTQPKQEKACEPDAPGRRHAEAPAGSVRVLGANGLARGEEMWGQGRTQQPSGEWRRRNAGALGGKRGRLRTWGQKRVPGFQGESGKRPRRCKLRKEV